MAIFGLALANQWGYPASNAQVRDSCHRLIGSPIEEASASTHFGAWRPHPRDVIRDDDPTTQVRSSRCGTGTPRR